MSEAKWCDVSDMDSWSDAEITDYYDCNPGLSNVGYAQQLGMSCTDLNDILMDRAKS